MGTGPLVTSQPKRSVLYCVLKRFGHVKINTGRWFAAPVSSVPCTCPAHGPPLPHRSWFYCPCRGPPSAAPTMEINFTISTYLVSTYLHIFIQLKMQGRGEVTSARCAGAIWSRQGSGRIAVVLHLKSVRRSPEYP